MNCEQDVSNWLNSAYAFSGRNSHVRNAVVNMICEHGPNWGNQVAWSDYLDNLDIPKMIEHIIMRFGPDYHDERNLGMM